MRLAAKRILGLADRVVPTRNGVTILIYHRVGGGSGGEVDLDVDEFRRHLAHLRSTHRVVPIEKAAAALTNSNGERDESRNSSVVVTFDDGTADFVEHALPLLTEYEIPATLYVATQFVESGEPFPWDAPPASWGGLSEALSTGLVTIGSHTHSHALLDRSEPGEIADELDRSIDLIQERLGVNPVHFAYPKALPGSSAAEGEVRRRFTTAALARSRVNVAGQTDPHRLWRTPIQRSDGFEFFAAKAAGGMRLEGELRDLVARVRYRNATR
ncbi:MAG: polysaccharide deacetylase family protein [Actinomycetota bacterium]